MTFDEWSSDIEGSNSESSDETKEEEHDDDATEDNDDFDLVVCNPLCSSS